MRAKGTLAVLCVLMGVATVQLPAEATERSPRTAQKQERTTTASRSANTRQAATAPRQANQRQASNAARGNQARQASATPRASRPAAPPARGASQGNASNGQRSPSLGLMRPAFAMGAGTPILPVSITSGLSCVPFARMATGMNISGDARMWWSNAAGSYARGNAPERGAVLSFPSSGGMSRGHVAVVSRLVGARTIHIDHSNWGGPGIRRGQVMRGVVVMDVSDRNDWTAVRVQVGHDSSSFGRTYPTHGFIYNRPAGSRMMTAEAPRVMEVAEAASPHAAQHQRLTTQLLGQ